MSFFSKFTAGLSAFMKYAPMAMAAVKAVEAEVGASDGADKKALVIAYVLAASHAGQNVPIAQVQAIAGVVNLIVGMLNLSGVFGKTTASVDVPNIAAAPVAKEN